MAYEATVPVHRRLLWSAVTDPERLLGAVPNLVIEAGSEHGVAARLRLRAGEKSITFRGIARLVNLMPDELRAVLEIEAVHGRSDGALDGRVEIRLRPDGDGTRVELVPDFVLSGHAPTVPTEQLIAAAARLVPRWFAQVAGSAPQAHPAPVPLTVVPAPEPEPEAESETRTQTQPEPARRTARKAAPRSGAETASDAPAASPDSEPAADAHAEPADASVPESAPSAESADAAAPSAQSAQSPESAQPAGSSTAAGEARPGPTFKLIPGTGEGDRDDALDTPAAAKVPLRLVAPNTLPDAEEDSPEERDLWSERPGRLIAPLWLLGALLLGAAGLLAALLRRLTRRHRARG